MTSILSGSTSIIAGVAVTSCGIDPSQRPSATEGETTSKSGKKSDDTTEGSPTGETGRVKLSLRAKAK